MTIFEALLEVLKQDQRFFSAEGQLLRNSVYEAAMQMDPELIRLLLRNVHTRKHFFTSVEDVFVFDKIEFGWMINHREFLPNSFTRFKNKIGLIDQQHSFISSGTSVVLSFPYKDCVLEGGQSKEDQKRNETFYNPILAVDEIDRLFSPKVLAGAIRYTKDQALVAEQFDDEDNLLMKGNNLLAIASLLPRFSNQIKCIYIDIPYNTGNDSFQYNDRFNHSTWLTFMKNRLEIARTLLTNDGTIAISVDHYELAYILVLMDELFGRDNRKNIITVRRASVSGAKVINPGVVNIVEYVVLYAKDTNHWKPNRLFTAKAYDDRYATFILNYEKGHQYWKFTTVKQAFADHVGVDKSKLKKHFGDAFSVEIEQFVLAHAERVCRLAMLDESSVSQDAKALKSKSLAHVDQVVCLERGPAKPYYMYNGNIILFAKDRCMQVDGKLTFSQPLTDMWDDVLPNDLHNEGGVPFKKGKKPEKLIARILELCSQPGDRVLDFFAGSGTTGAVALKLGRRFILCEQMDYIETVTKQRLLHVIQGEKRGISNAVQWQGGGSFVFCELQQLNQVFLEKIERASTEQDRKHILDELLRIGYVKHQLNLSTLIDALEHEQLEFKQQMQLFIDVLDQNMLYVNYCDIDDEEFQVTEQTRAFNRSFYRDDEHVPL